jgi:hypothetical protein
MILYGLSNSEQSGMQSFTFYLRVNNFKWFQWCFSSWNFMRHNCSNNQMVKFFAKICSRGFLQNLVWHFWTFLRISSNFLCFQTLLVLKTIRNDLNLPWGRGKGWGCAQQGASIGDSSNDVGNEEAAWRQRLNDIEVLATVIIIVLSTTWSRSTWWCHTY